MNSAIQAYADDCPMVEPPPKGAVTSGVYVIQAGKYIKIGIAKRIDMRMKGIQTSCPLPVRLVMFHRHAAANIIERKAHTLLLPHMTHGEWFRVGSKKAVEVVQMAIAAVDDHNAGVRPMLRPTVSRASRRRERWAGSKYGRKPQLLPTNSSGVMSR